jgi:hypothetical protein
MISLPENKFTLQPSFQEKYYRLEALMPLFKEKLAAGKSVIFFPKGTSMMPMIRQGVDKVVLSPLPKKLKKYDLPLYQRDNGQYVLHRIVKAGDTYTCIGDNQYQYETGVRHDQMIGLVTGFYRDQEYHSATELSHRVYRFLWHHSRWLRPRVQAVKSKIRRLIKK